MCQMRKPRNIWRIPTEPLTSIDLCDGWRAGEGGRRLVELVPHHSQEVALLRGPAPAPSTFFWHFLFHGPSRYQNREDILNVLNFGHHPLSDGDLKPLNVLRISPRCSASSADNAVVHACPIFCTSLVRFVNSAEDATWDVRFPSSNWPAHFSQTAVDCSRSRLSVSTASLISRRSSALFHRDRVQSSLAWGQSWFNESGKLTWLCDEETGKGCWQRHLEARLQVELSASAYVWAIARGQYSK